MARDFNGTSDRLDYTSVLTPATNQPYTISMWLNTDQLSTTAYFFNVNDNTGTRAFTLFSWGTGLSGAVQMQVICSTSNLTTYSQLSLLSTSVWIHLAVKSSGSILATDVSFWKNGAAVAPSGMADGAGVMRTNTGAWSLGGRPSADGVNYNGRMAFVGYWSRQLSASEIYSLSRGYHPLCFPSSLEFAPDLVRDMRDPVSGLVGTYDGTTVAESPRIFYPFPNRIQEYLTSSGEEATATPSLALVTVLPFSVTTLITQSAIAQPALASVTVSLFDATALSSASAIASPALASVSFEVFQATASTSGATVAQPALASVSLQVFQATAVSGQAATATPALAKVSLQVFSPNVLVSRSALASPALATATIELFSATALSGASAIATPALASVSLVVYDVMIRASAQALPATALINMEIFDATASTFIAGGSLGINWYLQSRMKTDILLNSNIETSLFKKSAIEKYINLASELDD